MLIGKWHMIDNNRVKVHFFLAINYKRGFLEIKEWSPAFAIWLLKT